MAARKKNTKNERKARDLGTAAGVAEARRPRKPGSNNDSRDLGDIFEEIAEGGARSFCSAAGGKTGGSDG